MKAIVIVIAIALLLLYGAAVFAVIQNCVLTTRVSMQEEEIDAMRHEWTRWRSRAFLQEKIVLEVIRPRPKRKGQASYDKK